MQRDKDRWPEDDEGDTPGRSRPGSRRNSGSGSRRNSTKKEKEAKKKSPLNSVPSSATVTPKKTQKPQSVDFMITGKQLLKKSDRASSLPGYNRRPSAENIKKKFDSPKKSSQSPKSRDTSLEDDMSLDLSQVSDFEDTNSKYGIKQKFGAVATSTPKPIHKSRSGSQSYMPKIEALKRNFKSFDSRQSSCYSRDSLYKTPSSNSQRFGRSTDLDYSSVSPEYSGLSSVDVSPRGKTEVATPQSQDLQVSSFCVSSWQDCSEDGSTRLEQNGEWTNFWANYNNSLSRVPIQKYYDQCPTPYRTENFDLADFEFSTSSSRRRSPEDAKHMNTIIRNEGLHLTPRETQNMIKCAHLLGSVLSKAIERRSKEKDLTADEKIKDINDKEVELKKRNFTLDLKETALPIDVVEEKRCETVTTQTDISLPNTKSAPKIFEKILRQLSRSSLEDLPGTKTEESGKKEDVNISVKENGPEEEENK